MDKRRDLTEESDLFCGIDSRAGFFYNKCSTVPPILNIEEAWYEHSVH